MSGLCLLCGRRFASGCRRRSLPFNDRASARRFASCFAGPWRSARRGRAGFGYYGLVLLRKVATRRFARYDETLLRLCGLGVRQNPNIDVANVIVRGELKPQILRRETIQDVRLVLE